MSYVCCSVLQDCVAVVVHACTRARMHTGRPVEQTQRACCNTLQHIEIHRATLHHAAPRCNTLQRTATHGHLANSRTACAASHCNTHCKAHCNTLQLTATHCIALQLTATHCNTLRHTATHCNTLRSGEQSQHACCNTLPNTATHCPTLHHTETWRTISARLLHHTAPHRTTLQHTAPHCNTLQHTATHSSTQQHTARHGDLANGLSALAGFGELLAYRGFALILRQVREPGHLLRRHLQCVAVCCSVVQ